MKEKTMKKTGTERYYEGCFINFLHFPKSFKLMFLNPMHVKQPRSPSSPHWGPNKENVFIELLLQRRGSHF